MKHVCILNGIHRGAVIGIDEAPVLVGGNSDCDCLLSDESAGGVSVKIFRDSNNSLLMEAVQGDVLRNGRRMRSGKQLSLETGTVIGLGNVEIALGDNLLVARESAALRDRRRMVVSGSVVGAACIGVFALIGIVGGPADAFNFPGLGTKVTPPPSIVSVERDPLIDLKRELEKIDLSSAIELSRDETGQIFATGAVDDRQREQWSRLIRWFDGRFGNTTTLTSRLTESSDDYVMLFQIKSVYAAPNPRLVLQDGRSFPVGAILPGGWEIRSIAGMKVELSRETEFLVISF